MASLASQVGAVSLINSYRIEAKDGYYLGTSHDGKHITGRGCRYYTEGFFKGDRYEGDLIDDNRHGNGGFFYGDGSRSEGTFRDGKLNGNGNNFP